MSHRTERRDFASRYSVEERHPREESRGRGYTREEPRRGLRHESRREPRKRSREPQRVTDPADIVPVPVRRKRTKTAWDVPPSAEQIAAGISAIPLDPLGSVSDPLLGAHAQLPPQAANRGNRQIKRLYVGNLPPTTERELMEFLGKAMEVALVDNIDPNSSPVISVYLRTEKRFAFVEFRTPEEATSALALDGIEFKGNELRIKRPAGFTPSVAEEKNAPRMDTSRLGLGPAPPAASAVSIYIAHIPTVVADKEMEEILLCYGPLRAFHLVRDPSDHISRGYGYVEYKDRSDAKAICASLSGLELCGSQLELRLAATPLDKTVDGHVVLHRPSPILCLMNAASRDELLDDREFSEIRDDILQECRQYGTVVSSVFTQPSDTMHVPGEDKFLIEYDSIDAAKSAKDAIQGRMFGLHPVTCQFYSPDRYHARQY